MKELQVVVMTKEEAEECVTEIRHASHRMRELLVDLYERDGWKALGYESFADCAQQEFDASVAYMYRQLAVGELEKRLPIGDIGDNRESHLRPLITTLKDDDMRVEAWNLAYAMEKSPTASTFQNAAYTVAMSNMVEELPILVGRMKAGDVSPRSAYSIAQIISGDSVSEELKYVCSHITDPALAPMLRRISYEDSDTWAEILATGCIPTVVGEQTPIGEANAQTLKSYLDVASNEHRAAAVASRKDYWDMLNAAIDHVIDEARKAASCSESLEQALKEYDAIASKEV